MATTSATPDPDRAPNSMHATTMASARPPLTWPTRAEQRRTMRSVSPDRVRRPPASTKSGIASSVKESSPATVRCAATISGAVSEDEDIGDRGERRARSRSARRSAPPR